MRRFVVLAMAFSVTVAISAVMLGTTPIQRMAFHILVLTPATGVLVGWFVAKSFRISRSWAMTVMLVGVTASAWLAMWLDGEYLVPIIRARYAAAGLQPIEYSWRMVWWLVAAWVGGLGVLMLPWSAIAIERGQRRLRSVVSISLVATMIVVGLAAAFHVPHSTAGLLRAQRVAPGVLVRAGRGESVYFVNAEDGHLWRVSLDGRVRERVSDTVNFQGASFVRLDKWETVGRKDDMLWIEANNGSDRDDWDRILTFPPGSLGAVSTDTAWRTTVFKPKLGRGWKVQRSMLPDGLVVTDLDGQRIGSYCVDLPFVTTDELGEHYNLRPVYTTLLEDGLIVTQCGMSAGTIVVIDPAQGRLAILAHGFAPIVSTAKPDEIVVSGLGKPSSRQP